MADDETPIRKLFTRDTPKCNEKKPPGWQPYGDAPKFEVVWSSPFNFSAFLPTDSHVSSLYLADQERYGEQYSIQDQIWAW